MSEAIKTKVQAVKGTTLRWNRDTKSHDEIPVSPTVFERDGRLYVSAEDGLGFADYYGEYRGGYPWIHPALEKIASEVGAYWEWENPGCIVLVN